MEIVNVANNQNKKLVSIDVAIKQFFILTFCHVINSIQEIIVWTKLIQHWNNRDQIDTTERLEIKLKYNVKEMDQIHTLPYFL